MCRGHCPVGPRGLVCRGGCHLSFLHQPGYWLHFVQWALLAGVEAKGKRQQVAYEADYVFYGS